MDTFKNDGKETERLRYYQSNFRCCGSGGHYNGYDGKEPESCRKSSPPDPESVRAFANQNRTKEIEIHNVVKISDQNGNEVEVRSGSEDKDYYQDSCLDKLSKTLEEQQGI